MQSLNEYFITVLLYVIIVSKSFYLDFTKEKNLHRIVIFVKSWAML